VKAKVGLSEPLSNFLIEQETGGVVVENQGKEDELVLKSYVPTKDQAQSLKKKLSLYLRSLEGIGFDVGEKKITFRKIKKKVWEKFWKRDFEPFSVTNRIMIKPSWNKERFYGKMVIKIDPKMAFGTGKHESTKLCIRELEKYVKPKDKVLDLGTGSGILSIISAKLGASYILGLDIDKIAIENAYENVKHNRIGKKIELRVGTVDKNTPKNYFDLVVANLFKLKIIELFDRIKRVVKKNGIIILSGILDSEKKETERFLRGRKIKIIKMIRMNEWVCFIVKK
jgi:ribosomal protein L11 methyltransferase